MFQSSCIPIILGKRTPLEKQLILPTILANKLIFNNLKTKSNLNNVLFILHGLNLCLLEVLHTAYLFHEKVDIIEFATMEETITSTVEVGIRSTVIRINTLYFS